MTRSITLFGSALALLAGACAQSPPPSADPVELELALAAIESQNQGRAARLQEKIRGADRISSTLSRVAAEKLDPQAAAALLQ